MNFVAIDANSRLSEDDIFKTYVIRDAKKEDCKEIARLIQELADFEKMPDGPKLTVSVLEKDGFETEPPLFHCVVVQPTETGDNPNNLWGYALFYNTYSTWTGKVLFLEDIYISSVARSKKIGSALYRHVCKIALEENCSRMDFQVLSWNPARKFYESHGAIDLTTKENWHVYRMTKEALEDLRTTN